MSNFAFEYPFLLLLIPPIIYCLYRCKEIVKPVLFVNLHLFSKKSGLKNIELLLKSLIVALLCVALASPIYIDRDDPLNATGKDIVIALDASGSMNASGYIGSKDTFKLEDSSKDPSRLSRFEIAKVVAGEFILKRLGDNFGVVVFGDFAFIASPITYEKEILLEMLSYTTQAMAGDNTAIGDALAVSVRAFRHSRAKSKVVILLSDGEQNSGTISIKDALQEINKERIKVYTIGIGKEGEADEALLVEIAKVSGGEFFRAKDANELQKAYGIIDTLESSNIKAREFKFKIYYYFIALLFASFVLLYLLVKEAKR